LAYNELRTGRLVIPVALSLPSGRGYYLVCPKRRGNVPQVQAFSRWIKEELAALDWKAIRC
jgi:LysR family glycine cleavage system transcriptional activator